MIMIAFFDFDYCLFLSDSAHPTLDAIFRTQVRKMAGLRDLPEDEVVAFIWRNAPDVIVEHFKLSDLEAQAFLEFYENLPVPAEAVLYEDTWSVLAQLKQQGIPMFLITKGQASFQRRKIDHVGIAGFFCEVHIVGHKGAQFPTKLQAFTDITTRWKLDPATICTIGDGHEEITAGRTLNHGMVVQTVRPGVQRHDKAHHHIETLHGLRSLLAV
jgi:FMN phosphatase YigB (HAD superfamily)